MKYFLDTEFHEFQKKPLFGKPIDTIELISIGIVSEDIVTRRKLTREDCNECSINFTIGCELCTKATDNSNNGGNPEYHLNDKKDLEIKSNKEYYAICKEFDIKAAWNKWQPRTGQGDRNNIEPKEYWLRDNVLLPIFEELFLLDVSSKGDDINQSNIFSYRELKRLINHYGKTRKQIAEEIKEFVGLNIDNVSYSISKPKFYAYYADYDWVVFCWLFGRMIDLPRGFPMYCKDLKQELDSKGNPDISTLKAKNNNEHNALSDARFNYELYKYLTVFKYK